LQLQQVLEHARKLREDVQAAVARSPLLDQVDRGAISRLVAQTNLDFWKKRQRDGI
jgi:hypothetical protein